jgi:hypothetical protein
MQASADIDADSLRGQIAAVMDREAALDNSLQPKHIMKRGTDGRSRRNKSRRTLRLTFQENFEGGRASGGDGEGELVDCHAIRNRKGVDAFVGRLSCQQLPHHNAIAEKEARILATHCNQVILSAGITKKITCGFADIKS